jgi:hypothetical protein
MKQGTGRNYFDRKMEPKAHAVSESAVAQLGNHLGNHATGVHGPVNKYGASKPLYEGRGYEAPKSGEESHHCGSQGRH